MGCITSREKWPPWPKPGRDVIEWINVTVATSTGPATVKAPIVTQGWFWPCMVGNGGGDNEKVNAAYMCHDASQAQENCIRAMEDRGD